MLYTPGPRQSGHRRRLGLQTQQKVLLDGRITETRGWKGIPCALLSSGLRLLGFNLEDLKHVAMKAYFCVSVGSMINTETYGRSRADADQILHKKHLTVGKVEMNQWWKYKYLVRCILN